MEHTHSTTVGEKGRLTLPDDVRKRLGVGRGDVLLIEMTDNGTAELIPVALVPKDQLWFAHPEIQARVTEALEDIESGRATEVRTASELRAHLKRLKSESPSR